MLTDFKCPRCDHRQKVDTASIVIDFRCPKCGHIEKIHKSRVEAQNAYEERIILAQKQPTESRNKNSSKPTSNTSKSTVPTIPNVNKPSEPVAPSNALYTVIDTHAEKGLNEKLRKEYPQILKDYSIDKDEAMYFIRKAIPNKIQTNCIVTNYSDESSTVLAIRITNSSLIKRVFGKDKQLCISGKAVTNGKFAIFKIEIIHETRQADKDVRKDICFIHEFRTADGTYLNTLANSVPRYSKNYAGELKQWSDYIKWKLNLTQLKLCSAKYIGRRIAYDKDDYPYGIEFLAVATDEDALDKCKLNFSKSNEDMAVYGNDVSKDKWLFSFDMDRKKTDRGTPLPYLNLKKVEKHRETLLAFEAADVYSQLRRESDEYIDPQLFIATFGFDSEDEEIFDREYQKPYDEQDIDGISDRILRGIPAEGFISTTRVGDFALYKRLQSALDDLRMGKATSPNLSTWLFDITKADNSADEIEEPKWSQWGEDKLNASQKETIKKMLAAKEVFLCQGPPGTGKTTVIAEAVYQMVNKGKRVLIASQTNLAVNNALSVLMKNYPRVRAVRLGDSRKLDETVDGISESNIITSYFTIGAHYLHEDYLDKWEKYDKQLERLQEDLNTIRIAYKGAEKAENDEEINLIDRKIAALRAQRTQLTDTEDEIDINTLNSINQITRDINKLKDRREAKTNELVGENQRKLKELEREYDCPSQELENKLYVYENKLQREYPKRKTKDDFGDYIKDFTNYIEKQNGDFSLENDRYFTQYINSCNVVGVSCTESSQTLYQKGFNTFDVTIIDEVSKATPPELLIPLLLSEKIVLVGDHRQLPPLFSEHINSYEEYIEHANQEDPEVQELMTTENYSRFKDLVSTSLFKRHFEEADTNNKGSLLVQYRMHREIMDLINNFYSGKLQAGLSLEEEYKIKKHYASIKGTSRKPIITPEHHAYWVDTSKFCEENNYEIQSQGSSKYNPLEAKLISKLIRDIDDSYEEADYKGAVDVGIISFYGDQVKLIKKLLPEKRSLKHVVTDVNTVDRFQGKEKPIIIVSLVRNVPEWKKPRIDASFVNFYQRINVAFSRAQALLIIVGATDMYYDQEILIDDMDTGNNSEKVRAYGKIIDNLNNNGCYLFADDLLGREYKSEVDNMRGNNR